MVSEKEHQQVHDHTFGAEPTEYRFLLQSTCSSNSFFIQLRVTTWVSWVKKLSKFDFQSGVSMSKISVKKHSVRNIRLGKQLL